MSPQQLNTPSFLFLFLNKLSFGMILDLQMVRRFHPPTSHPSSSDANILCNESVFVKTKKIWE